MKINKYFAFAFIYFFINTLGLPFGLTYTAILSPLLYLWIASKRRTEVLLPFLFCLVPFTIMHFITGIDKKVYLVSLLNYLSVYIFCQAFYTFLKHCTTIESIFRKLLIINFILCLIAIPFYFTSYASVFWINQFLTEGVENFLRLKMFTYEASYYAMVFTPLFFYFLVQFLLGQNTIKTWKLWPMLLLPFILSFSIGVMACIAIALAMTFLTRYVDFVKRKRMVNIVVFASAMLLFIVIAVFVFFPDNALSQRLTNIFSGKDVSGNSRTFEAFLLSMDILETRNVLWGVGLGHIKIFGADIIRDFYHYQPDFNIIAIPNSAAETLAIFGVIGFILRIFIEGLLFIYTRVWTSYFRLMLFFFIFTYQFTGSFITNVAEYVIWILAFTNVFTRFDVRQKDLTI